MFTRNMARMFMAKLIISVSIRTASTFSYDRGKKRTVSIMRKISTINSKVDLSKLIANQLTVAQSNSSKVSMKKNK